VDETDERRLRETLAAERRRLEGILDSVEDGVAFLDVDRRMVYANRAYVEMFALDPRDQIVGGTREEFFARVAAVTGATDEQMQRLTELSLAEGRTREEFRFQRPTPRTLLRTVKPLIVDGQDGYLVVWQDVSAERELAALREAQAMTDPLTGLFNRRGAEVAFAREVARARRSPAAPLAVALFDIDHFKRINDTLGHAAGDEVIRHLAAVLKRESRPFDVVARWGGEEFVAVVAGPLEGGRAFCERVRTVFAAEECPGGVRATLSAGVAAFTPDEELSATLARADARLYEAKAAGRNNVKS
jgi:diguanylate cyclase (GGDEF)-like protein